MWGHIVRFAQDRAAGKPITGNDPFVTLLFMFMLTLLLGGWKIASDYSNYDDKIAKLGQEIESKSHTINELLSQPIARGK